MQNERFDEQVDRLMLFFKASTIDELADKIGVKASTISGWKSRSIPKRRLLELLKEWKDINIEYISSGKTGENDNKLQNSYNNSNLLFNGGDNHQSITKSDSFHKDNILSGSSLKEEVVQLLDYAPPIVLKQFLTKLQKLREVAEEV
jgi:transcriptional regulator with XRE-family HTH domain